MAVESPTTLNLNFDSNVGPKLDYLQFAASLTLTEMRYHVVTNPRLLGYSTKRRYKPRYDACQAAGVDAAIVLSSIRASDAEFNARLNRYKKERQPSA